MQRKVWRILALVLTSALALPASAQMMGPMGQGGPGGGSGRGMMGGGRMDPNLREGFGGHASSHEGPLISIMLEHKQDLGLSADQERKLLDLRTEFSKDAIRRTAEIRVAEIELDSLLEQDTWDLGKIETKVKQIATLEGELRFGRIKTLAAGRAVLTPEQLEKLKQVGHRMRGMGGPGMMGPGTGGPVPNPFLRPSQPFGPGMPSPFGQPAPRQ